MQSKIMKTTYSIKLTGDNGGVAYLWHRDKGAFCLRTAKKYLREWKLCNPNGQAEIEKN